jgi:hypothetical protein
LVPAGARAAEPFRYPQARYGKGELKYINGLPVLTVEGTPEEIGEQAIVLTRRAGLRLFGYPLVFLKARGAEQEWPALIAAGTAMLPQFPPDHRRELEAAARASLLGRNLLVAVNTMFDIKKVSACSALIVEPGRSATKGPLFGRTLDIAPLDILHEYSLVTVYRPAGKRAFVAIGFPGLIGCLSGMNDAGLSLATLEVHASRDGTAQPDLSGTPYALCFRRVLEECATVEEAELLLRSMRRTTLVNLAICDTRRGAVFEITPKQVIVRRSVEEVCACTNHFRAPELATSTRCARYAILDQSRELARLDLADLVKKLRAVSQGELTLQTMIFEPAALRLHLALGRGPTSERPLQVLELAPLFKGENGRK